MISMRFSHVVLAIAAIALPAGAQHLPTAKASRPVMPLAIEDVLSMRTIAPVAPVVIAPNGQWVAYTLHNPHAAQLLVARRSRLFSRNGVQMYEDGMEVWVTNTESGRTQNLTGPQGVSWGGTWSPDGHSLAFFSDRGGVPQVWLWDTEHNRTRRASPVVIHTNNPEEVPRWLPSGHGVVVKIAPEGADTVRAVGLPERVDTSSTVATVHAFSSKADSSSGPNAAMNLAYVADLAIVDVSTGHVQRLARATAIPTYAVSPNGNAVAFAALHGLERYSSQDSRGDLNVVDVRTGASRVLVQDLIGHEARTFSWSPTSDAIAYCATTYSTTSPQDCFVAALSANGPRDLTVAAPRRYGSFFRAPLWSPDGQSLFLLAADTIWEAPVAAGTLRFIGTVPGHSIQSIVSPAFDGAPWGSAESQALYVSTRDIRTQREGIARIDTHTNVVQQLYDDDATSFSGLPGLFMVDASHGHVIDASQRADVPQDLWIADTNFTNRRQLTHMNPSLARYTFGITRQVEWLGLDGEPLRGVVLLPAGYSSSQRYPMVVWVYGNDHPSADLNVFGLEPYDYNMQVLATRGYAVFVPDAGQHVGTPMLDLAKTVLPGVNKVIEMGIADSARIGIGGYSYGGYSTQALIAQTQRFHAAVAIAGTASDLLSEYGELDENGFSFGPGWAESGQGLMRASPWERRDRYIREQPVLLPGPHHHSTPANAWPARLPLYISRNLYGPAAPRAGGRICRIPQRSPLL